MLLFSSLFCALLHCIVLSVVLLGGISVYVFWLPVLCTKFFALVLFISFNSSQSGFSSFWKKIWRYFLNSCVEIRIEMRLVWGAMSLVCRDLLEAIFWLKCDSGTILMKKNPWWQFFGKWAWLSRDYQKCTVSKNFFLQIFKNKLLESIEHSKIWKK